MVEHVSDEDLNLPDRRYWLEYHRAGTPISLRADFHLIAPSDRSEEIAQKRGFVSFKDWIYLSKDTLI